MSRFELFMVALVACVLGTCAASAAAQGDYGQAVRAGAALAALVLYGSLAHHPKVGS